MMEWQVIYQRFFKDGRLSICYQAMVEYIHSERQGGTAYDNTSRREYSPQHKSEFFV